MPAKKKTTGTAAKATAMVVLSALPARLATAASVNINMKALIATSALVVQQNQSLNFGTFTTGGAGGTVDVNTAGAATYTGVTSSPSTAPTEAILRIAGKNGPVITVSVTNPTVNVSNGTDTMQVNQFNVSTNAGGALITRAMTATTIFVPVGATLTVGAGQNPGTYTGNFTVQVVYQ